MLITIRTSHVALPPEERARIERRASFALARLTSSIKRVEVRLADTNGPRGGVDKRCRVLVHLDGGASAFIEDRDSDLATLIDRAIDRAGRATRKRLALATVGRRLPDSRHHLLTAGESL